MRGWSAFRRGEAIVGLLLLGLALYVIWSARSMPVGSLQMPGPGFFPAALGLLLALVSLAILLGLGMGGDAATPVAAARRETAITAAALVATTFLFERAGALITLGLLLAVLFLVLGRLSWWKAGLSGFACAALAWGIFVHLLRVSLPGPGF